MRDSKSSNNDANLRASRETHAAPPLHQTGKRIGVHASMIGTRSWMERLTTTLIWEDMPEQER